MGVVSSKCKGLHQRLGWGGLPDTERGTYFNDKLMMGWIELLCCPSTMGCTVVKFEHKNPRGGEPKYKIKLRLSHSEHVPRYQLHVVKNRTTKQWIVGHMEKTETHLRAKPGEFIRVQVWKMTCNAMKMELRRSALQRKSHLCMSAVKPRPTPSASDMLMMGMTIATQAKLDKDPQTGNYIKKSERWVQTIGVNNHSYKLTVEPLRSAKEKEHKEMKTMNVMRILFRGKKVCIARKQRFAGALGKVEQPYLGVQIKPSDPNDVAVNRMKSEEEEDHMFKDSLLDTHGLMLLLLCLAWSEETMSPQLDMTDRFIQAMRAAPNDPGSAAELGLSVSWDTADVKERLKHIEYAQFHDWETDGARESADDDQADEEEAQEEDPAQSRAYANRLSS